MGGLCGGFWCSWVLVELWFNFVGFWLVWIDGCDMVGVGVAAVWSVFVKVVVWLWNSWWLAMK